MVKYSRKKVAGLLLFYFLYYTFLALFFSLLMYVFYQTLDMKRPKWLLDKSLIGTNPAMGYRPMPYSDRGSSLIWYKPTNRRNIRLWVHELDTFLEPYTIPKEVNSSYVYCEPGKTAKLEENEVCDVPVENWYPCVSSNNYNYDSLTKGPCVFLKLNKIFNWEPEYYNSSTLDDNLPQHIKTNIKKIERHEGSDAKQLKHVWVNCEGEHPVDVDNLGPIQYFPSIGFGAQYFPFLNVKGYLSPLVAVFFERPKRGVLINIECKAWARNIKHKRSERRGSVHFELLIDD